MGLALEPNIGACDTSQGFVLFRPGGPIENSPRREPWGRGHPPPSAAPPGAAEATPGYTARRKGSDAPSGRLFPVGPPDMAPGGLRLAGGVVSAHRRHGLKPSPDTNPPAVAYRVDEDRHPSCRVLYGPSAHQWT